jgi:hypothetical protein
MADKIWFVSVNGAQLEGQHSADEVRAVIAGNVGASVMVWKQGLAGWVEARSQPELAGGAAPPAIPGTAPAPAPAPAAMPASGAGMASVAQHAGFLKSLFDIRFESLITPRMISALYILAMVLVALGTLFMIVSSIGAIVSAVRFSSWGMAIMSFVWLLLSPVLAIVYLAMARMFLEVVIVLFKIKDGIERLGS